MEIIGIIGDNDFGKEGKDVAVAFRFKDERDTELSTENGCAYVWIGGELHGEVNYCHQGDMGTDKMFTEEEKQILLLYVESNLTK